jgi:hypothetical protein
VDLSKERLGINMMAKVLLLKNMLNYLVAPEALVERPEVY